MIKSKNTCFAIIAGTFASAASVFGKLISLVHNDNYQDFILKGVLFSVMIICNTAVWTFFAKALDSSHSSLIPTVISTASNYILSVLFGIFVFGEATSVLWWLGFCLILSGLYLICTNSSDESKSKVI